MSAQSFLMPSKAGKWKLGALAANGAQEQEQEESGDDDGAE